MAALLKSRPKDSGESQGRPLEGIEIALTINGMVRSQGEPDRGEDNWCAAENSRENFDKLLAALKQNGMPPTVDFVVGRQHDQSLIESWLRSGNLIGNMSFTRRKMNKRPAQFVIEDLTRNDLLLAPYWKKFPPRKKYYRYPSLKPSGDPQAREQISAYLKTKGYLEAPATIKSFDGSFGDSYCAAAARGDQECISMVKAYFKSLLMTSTVRARAAARRIAGRDVKHILVIGANQFTCDNLGEILAWYKSLGVRFIPLDDALRDPVYSTDDAKGRPASRVILHASRRTPAADRQPK
ncbi:MAG TPA: polysaccharide deacetylase family protein [Blastocatellia bacterium]|nr:polysaccharide deacetylase family protein [Blastocatellia bacterium]